ILISYKVLERGLYAFCFAVTTVTTVTLGVIACLPMIYFLTRLSSRVTGLFLVSVDDFLKHLLGDVAHLAHQLHGELGARMRF
ncbi:MAG: hypothetical protein IK000_07985, partial [Bacteroidaceae bacterium]|nr:hypothetical protein [Bacteroidaceae bacterium]